MRRLQSGWLDRLALLAGRTSTTAAVLEGESGALCCTGTGLSLLHTAATLNLSATSGPVYHETRRQPTLDSERAALSLRRRGFLQMSWSPD